MNEIVLFENHIVYCICHSNSQFSFWELVLSLFDNVTAVLVIITFNLLLTFTCSLCVWQCYCALLISYLCDTDAVYLCAVRYSLGNYRLLKKQTTCFL